MFLGYWLRSFQPGMHHCMSLKLFTVFRMCGGCLKSLPSITITNV
nr:MAG TPA: hypothetical protein [Caudoviricetes sp.]